MTVHQYEICDCIDPTGAAPRNKKGLITHGECGQVKRSVVFTCSACGELSASSKIDYVRGDIYHSYYCDDCVKEYGFDAIDCAKKRCHNWPQ